MGGDQEDCTQVDKGKKKIVMAKTKNGKKKGVTLTEGESKTVLSAYMDNDGDWNKIVKNAEIQKIMIKYNKNKKSLQDHLQHIKRKGLF